jgi:DNA-binding beta-propeller fold protein YncE
MIRLIAILSLLLGSARTSASVAVETVDFLEIPGVEVNAAGPLLVRMDRDRNRLIVANTLSSAVTVVDCGDHAVRNIPVGGRALQHLKSEAMTIDRRTGDAYLVGTKCVYIVSPGDGTSKTIPTEFQFESIAVDEPTGNVFVAGRESKALGYVKAGTRELLQRKWLDTREDLINLNATPPPPIRKVVADAGLGRIIAVDGIQPALYLFDGRNGELIASRQLPLEAGGRWHLAGYNQQTHRIYLVVERADRKVVQAARIDVIDGTDVIVPLPEFTEGVGITYNEKREEVYVAYDNHPSVHVVEFENDGRVDEIALPAYGNDAASVDAEADMLYVASWAHGEIDVVDLASRRLVRRITGLGIIPHMFTMAFNPRNGLIYFPKGATAVNGTFGAAVTALDPATEKTVKIHTGWAPIDLVALPARGSFLVFNSEDRFAEVWPDGRYEVHELPHDYPIDAVSGPAGSVYLSYGPHQSYWPTVYIWGARDGVLRIDTGDYGFYDRRIPRQAQRMVLDKSGALYFTQNNWGREEQFLGVLEDRIRLFDANRRLRLVDEVEREITQRILEYDPGTNQLYLVRIGERDEDPSVLQVVDPVEKKVVDTVELGLTSTDLVFDDEKIYVANFDSRSVSVVDKADFVVREFRTGQAPLRLCRIEDDVMVVNHLDNSLQEVKKHGRTFKLPSEGLADNLFAWRGKAVVTSHSSDAMYVVSFDPGTKRFATLYELAYPFGETRFDSRNVSFYVRGQFGDAVFDITRAETDSDLRLWITDFLSGKLIIME